MVHLQIREDKPPLIHLSVHADDIEVRHELEPGDAFSVAGQQWRLDRVENLHDPRGQWEVILLRVG